MRQVFDPLASTFDTRIKSKVFEWLQQKQGELFSGPQTEFAKGTHCHYPLKIGAKYLKLQQLAIT